MKWKEDDDDMDNTGSYSLEARTNEYTNKHRGKGVQGEGEYKRNEIETDRCEGQVLARN